VVPAGSFVMGSSSTKTDSQGEGPQHAVTVAKPFAVAKFELTFAEWDACVTHGGCPPNVSDRGWGHGRQPVIEVDWDDTNKYVTWLSTMTGRSYHLLSEAEYEYAARAGTQTVFPWGDDLQLNGMAMANCDGCGSQWDNKQPAPAGSFPANRFGLYDMVGNVWEYTEDCFHDTYAGAPDDGSAWISDDCGFRVVRGGGFDVGPNGVISAARLQTSPDTRHFSIGFRVARSLDTR
jgi:formylglycine-generating enzyme required for sulfatase activity